MKFPAIFDNPDSQFFGLYTSLPKPILQYIFVSADPDIFLKLQKCCKLIFVKNSYLIFPSLRFYKGSKKVSLELRIIATVLDLMPSP